MLSFWSLVVKPGRDWGLRLCREGQRGARENMRSRRQRLELSRSSIGLYFFYEEKGNFVTCVSLGRDSGHGEEVSEMFWIMLCVTFGGSAVGPKADLVLGIEDEYEK